MEVTQTTGGGCPLCHAAGPRFMVTLACGYPVNEAVPEARIGYSGQYELEICGPCRAALLGFLEVWRDARVLLRGKEEPRRPGSRPRMVYGAVRWITNAEWEDHVASRKERQL